MHSGAMLFSRIRLCLFFLSMSAAVSFCGSADRIGTGVAAINAGQLRTARAIFEKIVSDQTASHLDRAVAYKNLGTIMFRLGESPDAAFAESERLFAEALKTNSSQYAREQYGFMLYQRANCLLSACEQQLRRGQLQGVAASPFLYINKYIHPASESLSKAKSFYPSGQAGDIGLLEIELYLTESRIWQICNQPEASQRAVKKALTLADRTLSQPSVAPDARKKLLLRKVQLLLEQSPAAPPHGTVRKILEEALSSSSGNAELDISVFTFYVKYLLRYDLLKTDDEFLKIERDIRAAIEKLEALRSANLADTDFTARKNYFADRTGLYEALIMLYAKRSRPFDMLMTLNRIRSRAMQDFMAGNRITDMAQLQRILAENGGMLIAYYVGVDHIWSVRISGRSAKISCSNFSGQVLVGGCHEVLKIFSDLQCLQAYAEKGDKSVPSAYRISHAIYREIFEDCHKAFAAEKCRHLYIMPNHILNYMPFAALVVNFDSENIFNSRFVADDALPITYLPSVNSLVAAPRTATGTTNLVFARAHYNYPAFCTKDPRNPENPDAEPSNLPNVEKEAEAIVELLGVKKDGVFRERNASEYNLTRMLSTPRAVVHIAAHSAPDPLNPLNSYLVLAAGHGEDGKLSVRELLSKHQGRFDVELLILSACDTNRGELLLLPGDDVASLANAFMVAGCRNAIATQWPASDLTFPRIMEHFHYYMSNWEPKDVSLALALKSFRDEARRFGKDGMICLYPAFWGNIVLNGGKQ